MKLRLAANVVALGFLGCGGGGYYQEPPPQQQPQPTTVVVAGQPTAQPVVVAQPVAQPVAQQTYVSSGGSSLHIGGSTPNFGSRSLTPGFLPDPYNVSVVSGGSIDARQLGLGAGCVGWVTREPDYILHLNGMSSNFRVYATSDYGDDVTLVINAANGSWHCNDDSYGGRNPSVDLPGAGGGQYDIWVGSYQQGVQARATLHFTELSGNHPKE